jgi:hypothetical protein
MACGSVEGNCIPESIRRDCWEGDGEIRFPTEARFDRRLDGWTVVP